MSARKMFANDTNIPITREELDMIVTNKSKKEIKKIDSRFSLNSKFNESKHWNNK